MKLISILTMLIGCAAAALGEAPQFTSSGAVRALEDYEKRVKEADTQYYRDLQEAQKSAMKAGKLDEANLIQAELDKLKSRYVTLEQGKPREVSVDAEDFGGKPKATGIMLKKGQKFSLEPNREDKWTGGGTKAGVFCDFMGYDDRGNKWMRMMYRIGKGPGVPVEAGRLQTAKDDGELFLYADDDGPAGNSGKIRVNVLVSPN